MKVQSSSRLEPSRTVRRTPSSATGYKRSRAMAAQLQELPLSPFGGLQKVKCDGGWEQSRAEQSREKFPVRPPSARANSLSPLSRRVCVWVRARLCVFVSVPPPVSILHVFTAPLLHTIPFIHLDLTEFFQKSWGLYRKKKHQRNGHLPLFFHFSTKSQNARGVT